MHMMRTCLWFDTQAEEAANFYVSLFDNSRVTDIQYYGANGMRAQGTVLTVAFELNGHQIIALNGGPEFTFSEAISLSVDCADQNEVDHLWQQLTADGGQESQCGWLKDKFGLSWQIVPTELREMISDPDEAKAQRAMAAMMTMHKIDILKLRDAVNEA